ncbi:MAG: 4-carboxymuconolactone decarboxylase, partial [uncultured Gemmatimonadaceae bacterium]
ARRPQWHPADQQSARGELHGRRPHQRLLRAPGTEPAGRGHGHLRPRRAHALEGEPARSDAHHHERRGPGAGRGRGGRRDPRRRRRLVSARAAALGGCHTPSSDDLFRHPRGPVREGRRVQGEGDGRGIRAGAPSRL